MNAICYGKTTRKHFLILILLGFLLLLSRVSPALDYEAGFNGATRDYDKSSVTGDPISAANGAYHFTVLLLSLGGPMNW